HKMALVCFLPGCVTEMCGSITKAPSKPPWRGVPERHQRCHSYQPRATPWVQSPDKNASAESASHNLRLDSGHLNPTRTVHQTERYISATTRGIPPERFWFCGAPLGSRCNEPGHRVGCSQLRSRHNLPARRTNRTPALAF